MRTQLAPGTADHVVEGIRIRVTTYGGPGDGLDNSPAVLLLHGFPTSSQLWRQVGPCLRFIERHCVVQAVPLHDTHVLWRRRSLYCNNPSVEGA